METCLKRAFFSYKMELTFDRDVTIWAFAYRARGVVNRSLLRVLLNTINLHLTNEILEQRSLYVISSEEHTLTKEVFLPFLV